MNDVAAKPRIYLDTNVFIRAFEGGDEEAAALKVLFEALRLDRERAVTSELTLAEVLAGPELHIKRRFYLNLIVWSRFIDLIPVSRSILIETADLRKVAKHKLPDAIHGVTAVHAGWAIFASYDKGIRTPKEIQFVLPDQSGVAVILDALHA